MGLAHADQHKSYVLLTAKTKKRCTCSRPGARRLLPLKVAKSILWHPPATPSLRQLLDSNWSEAVPALHSRDRARAAEATARRGFRWDSTSSRKMTPALDIGSLPKAVVI